MDPYFIRTRIVYDLHKPIIKAVMEWKKTLTAGEMSLTLRELKFRLSQAYVINENKEEYMKAITEVKKEEVRKGIDHAQI